MSDLLARLINAGMPADLIAEVAMEIARADVARRQEAEAQAKAEKKRTDAARRQREFKARQRGEITQNNADNALPASACVTDPSLSLPPNENNSNPPTHTHPDQTTRARKATRLPSDWKPEPFDEPLSSDVATWASGEIERELARFRDWAASAPGQRGVKSDWQATWRNWCRRKHDERPSNVRSPTHRGPSAQPDRRSSLAKAIDEGLEWLDGGGAQTQFS